MNGRFVFSIILILIASASGLLMGCGTFGGRHNGGDTFTDTVLSPSPDQAKTRLNEIIREHIQATHYAGELQQAPVIKRRPYYLKECSMYPDGTEVFSVDIREADSQIRPLLAEVTINKIRISTRMHRKQNLAAADGNFLRDTGVETLVFELRNGRWTRTGAIFNAKTTEELIDGVWSPRRDETERVIPEEDKPGWFQRAWNRIRGGE